MAREGLLNGKTQYSGPPCKTSLDQLLFKMKILFTFIQKATLMRFSIVLTLLPQLVFLGLAINFAYFCHRKLLLLNFVMVCIFPGQNSFKKLRF